MCYPTRLCEDFEAAVNLLSGKIKPHVVVQRGEVAAKKFMMRLVDYCTVAIRPQMVKYPCISVIPGSVMLTHTVLEGFIK